MAVREHVLVDAQAMVLTGLVTGWRLQPLMNLHSHRRIGWEVLSQLSVPSMTEFFFDRLSPDAAVSLFMMQAEELLPFYPTENLLMNLPVRALLADSLAKTLISQGNTLHGMISVEIQDPAALRGMSHQERHQLVVALMRLREEGWAIWMDDLTPSLVPEVGSLGLMFDGVKTDWREMRRRHHAPRALGELVSQAKYLGERVLVEGIESEADLQHARESGADYGQGFLWPEKHYRLGAPQHEHRMPGPQPDTGHRTVME